ncbi:Clr5 domain-containing protein [Podospora didyma]|uniref:Clr5 domain-containing protein n=1 Tax=Podospora didyma TaxID=330526 RepID=A0AAE0P3P6_9PEZI|nr:Clr5 domain-containing protein [Podospora didyma]
MSADPTSPWATKAPMILSSTRANTSLSPNQCQNVAASDFTLQSWPPSFPPPYSAQIDANRCATHRLDTDQAEALPLSVTREHAELEDERNPDLTTVGAAGFPGQQISSCVSSPNKQDWNSHRSVIAQLYLDLNLPLKDVKKVMEDRHNFIASFRAYKHRFRTWEWFKYKASHVPGDGRQQMPACIRSSQRRGQVLADLGGGSQTTALVSLSAAVGVAGVPGLSSSSTPLFTIPVDDELSRHKAHAIQTMRNLLRYMSENHSYHHVQRFAKVTYYFKEGLQHFAHRPETGSLYLTRAFRWLDHGMRRSPPQTISFIVCCLPCQVLRTFSSSPSLANATLGAFFDYVARFLAIRGANPMSTTIASIMHVLQKAPEQLSDLRRTGLPLSRLHRTPNADCIR